MVCARWLIDKILCGFGIAVDIWGDVASLLFVWRKDGDLKIEVVVKVRREVVWKIRRSVSAWQKKI